MRKKLKHDLAKLIFFASQERTDMLFDDNTILCLNSLAVGGVDFSNSTPQKSTPSVSPALGVAEQKDKENISLRDSRAEGEGIKKPYGYFVFDENGKITGVAMSDL